MATRADQLKTATQRANSASRRKPAAVKPIGASTREKWSVTGSKKGRAIHGPTKSRADAKAGKPGDGKTPARWKTGPNGGEEQTMNGVEGTGRGADGPANRARPSRKSTRGSWPAGEKRSTQLTRRAKRAVSSPEQRAMRGK